MRILCSLVCLLLASCQTARFYGQAMTGQTEILLKQRANAKVIEDPKTDPSVVSKLELIARLRTFAETELGLPSGKNYTTYADLKRKHVSWILTAAPEFSLEAKEWYYPIVGRLKYQGYFSEDQAQAYATSLQEDGWDVQVGGTDAYSTLGFFRDPVLNTFIHYSEADLAELLFHELTHRRYFRKGETDFNEALATAVGREGTRRWLAAEGKTKELKNYVHRIDQTSQFFDTLDRTRERLTKLYASDLPESHMRPQKKQALASLQDDLRDLRRQWGGRGLSTWLDAPLTNAHITSVLTYYQRIPEFEMLIARHQGDLDALLAELEKTP